ncbi:Phosphate-specific transport system accessory protein PhoU [bioreactor metagenome]|uniref:Phosphate-specific transport system accessory protein PhoU n=1 Tax=bioreactor metagenome TaxID=1076179 RepID=A0A644T6J9_9ZZZZ|nr:phosphate signaling complex protein PhoU [Methanobrevibacter sp.]MEA4956825.1 phosphate signaling complex protein PhoU [Methanobrevibacter sp.]
MDKEYPRISFKNRINNVKDEAEKMGQMVMETHRNAITLLNDYDEKIADDVLEKSKEIDQAAFDLERRCIKFIAVEQPVAGDLMFIESTIRVSSHMKRIGYLAANIADLSVLIKDVSVPDKLMEDLQYMADYVQMMLSKGFYAFLNQNLDTAKELRNDDDKVDDLFDSILEQVTDNMFQDKENISQTINLIFIARFLERIADRAVDIGRRTIFMMTFKKPKN